MKEHRVMLVKKRRLNNNFLCLIVGCPGYYFLYDNASQNKTVYQK